MKRAVYIALLIFLSFSVQHCRKEQEEIIPDPIVLTATIDNVKIYRGYDGSIDLTVSGGIPPYSFLWSNGEQIEDIDSLAAGIYIVLVTDESKQTKSDTFIVAQPKPDTL